MLTKELTFRGKSYKIAYTTEIECHPSWYSFEDESSVREANWHILPDDVVLDIGASYGSYTMPALSQGASYVWAWSPYTGRGVVDTGAEMMRKTLALNGWSDKCCVIESGVYDRVGWLNVDTQEFHTSSPAILNGPANGLPLDVIQVTTIDLWMDQQELSRVDWMKLDVEGAEEGVIRGAKNLISRFCPKILVENHLFRRASLYEEVRNLLVGGGLGVKYKEISTVPYHSISHSLYFPAI
jgi:FkbM family methyltransferase